MVSGLRRRRGVGDEVPDPPTEVDVRKIRSSIRSLRSFIRRIMRSSIRRSLRSLII